MSEPSGNPPRFVTCLCQHCSGHLEFDADELGRAENAKIPCPHCGLETHLREFLPRSDSPQPPPNNPQRPRQPPRPEEADDGEGAVWWFFSIVGIGVGLALILNGCNLATESAIHQIYAAIQYCTGYVLIGIALLIIAVVRRRGRH